MDATGTRPVGAFPVAALTVKGADEVLYQKFAFEVMLCHLQRLRKLFHELNELSRSTAIRPVKANNASRSVSLLNAEAAFAVVKNSTKLNCLILCIKEVVKINFINLQHSTLICSIEWIRMKKKKVAS
ncbi:uncharacterized protein LOC130753209 [Actinidia eriantha]|uniref:uncharacterized protein LOC130753209 n=1 Tax=Actinidia eriantha TaxID=165200 RepID=UPI00258990DA|nr:uncharacterized protein LOC130753209 [Actinidia eriantha]